MEEISMEQKIKKIIELVGIYGTSYRTLERSEDQLCRLIRETFASKKDFDDYEISDDTDVTIKFPDFIRGLIYDTLQPGYKQIIEQWKSLQSIGRKRTDAEDKICRKKKSIYDNLLVRYKKIMMRTFGPTCLRCNSQDKWAFSTNCNCIEGGVCIDCIQEGCNHITATDSYKYYCEKCCLRVMIYKDVNKKIHSLNSLFGYNETPLDENDNDDFFNQVPVLVPVPPPVPNPVSNPVPTPTPAPVRVQERVPVPTPTPAPDRAQERVPVPDPNPPQPIVKNLNFYKNLSIRYDNQLKKCRKTIDELRAENKRLKSQINA